MTTWSIERRERKWLTARPECPAPMTTVVVRTGARTGSVDLHGHAGRVRHHVEHGRALLRLGNQGLDLLGRRVRVDVVLDPDLVESVSRLGVATENPQDVHVALDRRLHRVELDATVLRDCGDA